MKLRAIHRYRQTGLVRSSITLDAVSLTLISRHLTLLITTRDVPYDILEIEVEIKIPLELW